MKKVTQQIFLSSLSALAVTATSLTYANEGVTVPSLEGGFIGSVGALYLTPSSDLQTYIGDPASDLPINKPTDFTALNVTPGYQFGIDASIGYIFEDTANAIELDYRNITTSDKGSSVSSTYLRGPISPPPSDIEIQSTRYPDLGYELNSFDLMLSQFVNLGEHMQLRLLGGLAYTEIEYNLVYSGHWTEGSNGNTVAEFVNGDSSEFKGWGPRVGLDTRYDFGQGFGVVGGASLAYYLGELNATSDFIIDNDVPGDPTVSQTDTNDLENHNVQNIRANLGVDYVYFFDNEESYTVGLELGYLVDYYEDAAGIWNGNSDEQTITSSAVSFSGPYLNLKGVF